MNSESCTSIGQKQPLRVHQESRDVQLLFKEPRRLINSAFLVGCPFELALEAKVWVALF